MLTPEQIEQNKKRFIELISSITIEGANIKGLLDWLENRSDFFSAPASTKYHCSYEGGLCEHSLDVYDDMVILNDAKDLKLDDNSIKIVALLHDISKANFYEQYFRNVKNDVTGQWEKVSDYRVREDSVRFIYGNHEQNSEFMVRNFIPLSVAESTAILHHHAGMSWDSAKEDCASVFNRYSIASALHTADFMSTFITERK